METIGKIATTLYAVICAEFLFLGVGYLLDFKYTALRIVFFWLLSIPISNFIYNIWTKK